VTASGSTRQNAFRAYPQRREDQATALVAGIALAARARHVGLPLAALICGLAAFAAVAVCASLLGSMLASSLSPTLRFWHGMVSGMGVGALLSVLALYIWGRNQPMR
jgi:hypothetical protein